MGDRHRYIVGLDFGTTYTGISHVDSTKSTIHDIQVVRNWPGPSKEYDEVWKTPSKIAYRLENPDTKTKDTGAEIWGYQVTPGMTSYSWMKLLLDSDTTITEFDDASLDQGVLKLPIGKTATDVCADYLKGVYAYTMSELERIWGAGMIKMTPIEFWLTVPATWSDKAKSATKDAAIRAGFGNRTGDGIFLITEPEAAAVASLSGLNADGVQNQVKPGDGILICDCGGGTVDINTYIITATSPKLEFDELVVGKGGKVGSTFIDRQFQHWMTCRFGTAYTNLPAKKTGPGSRFMKEFEALKRDFGGDRNVEMKYEVPLVMRDADDSDYYDVEEAMVKFTNDEMESFFAPAIGKIQALLKTQVQKANRAMPPGEKLRMIILVGGFGDSQYLNDQLKAWCKKNGGLTMLCPPHPQAAIVKGAALRGLGDIKPSIRRCRRHYGFSWSNFFRPGIDPEERAYIDHWNGLKMCSDRVEWQIEKGDEITQDTFMFTNVVTEWSANDSRIIRLDLYASNSEIQPQYKEDHDVFRVGTLEFDFSGIDVTRSIHKQYRGRRAYRIGYKVQVMMGNKEGLLSFNATMDDIVLGHSQISFSDDK